MTFKNLANTDVPIDPGYCSFNAVFAILQTAFGILNV